MLGRFLHGVAAQLLLRVTTGEAPRRCDGPLHEVRAAGDAEGLPRGERVELHLVHTTSRGARYLARFLVGDPSPLRQRMVGWISFYPPHEATDAPLDPDVRAAYQREASRREGVDRVLIFRRIGFGQVIPRRRALLASAWETRT